MQSRIQPVAEVPWWRVGTMWLVVGGLAVVVAGSVALAVTAWTGADVVVLDAPAARTVATTPALQGRNHAAAPPLARR